MKSKKVRIVKLAMFASLYAFSLPALADNVLLQDIQVALSQSDNSTNTKSNSFGAYKTLENLTSKFGLDYKKSNSSKPITRKEAAIMLVNLVGKIEERNIKLNEVEKAKIEVIKEELSLETKALMSKVTGLESSVSQLKGNVSKLAESDKKSFKYEYGKDYKIGGTLQAQYTGTINKDYSGYPNNFYFPLADITVEGKVHENIGFLGRYNIGSSQLSDIYVSTNIFPNHTVYLGQTRIPIGQEGAQSPATIETIDKAQISRNFGDTRDTGIKVRGNYDFVDYYLGVYNGDGANNLDNINGEVAFTGWTVLKPFYKTPELGELELGGGVYNGRFGNSGGAQVSNNIWGTYAGYRYGKYFIKGEYSLAKGYGATNGLKASGWYLHNSYMLNDKWQLVGRVDSFDPNRGIGKNRQNEYTIGVNYAPLNNFCVLVDFVHVDNQASQNSERIGVLTQVTF